MSASCFRFVSSATFIRSSVLSDSICVMRSNAVPASSYRSDRSITNFCFFISSENSSLSASCIRFVSSATSICSSVFSDSTCVMRSNAVSASCFRYVSSASLNSRSDFSASAESLWLVSSLTLFCNSDFSKFICLKRSNDLKPSSVISDESDTSFLSEVC